MYDIYKYMIYLHIYMILYIYIHIYICGLLYIYICIYIVYCGNGDERIDFEAVKPTFSSSSRSSCLAPDRCGTFCSGQDDRGGTAWVMTEKKKRQICSFP